MRAEQRLRPPAFTDARFALGRSRAKACLSRERAQAWERARPRAAANCLRSMQLEHHSAVAIRGASLRGRTVEDAVGADGNRRCRKLTVGRTGEFMENSVHRRLRGELKHHPQART